MRVLSDAAEYALRAVVWMAQNPDGTHKVKDIAQGTRAAPGYLVKVLQQLSRAGIVAGQRGSHGGFTLLSNPSDLSALDVVNAVDPIERIRSCPLGISGHGCELCPMHRRVDNAIAAIEQSLAGSTVQEILNDAARPGPHCTGLLDGGETAHPRIKERASKPADHRNGFARTPEPETFESNEDRTMSSFKNPPISRHESLAPFSRDHYSGLVIARHLSKAAADDAVARRKAVAEFCDAWAKDISVHFEDEERLLLKHMTDDDRRRLLSDHEQLRRLAAEVQQVRRSTDPDPYLLERISQLLERHIRWEERELFQRLQSQLDEPTLQQLRGITEQIEAARPRNIQRAAPDDDA